MKKHQNHYIYVSVLIILNDIIKALTYLKIPNNSVNVLSLNIRLLFQHTKTWKKTITDPQLKLTTGLHLTNGKIKTQMSVSAVGKDMSITWLIYATKIHNKPLSMPYLLKIKLTFSSDDDPIDWAYESIQTVINNNLGTIDQTIVDLITDLHNELNTVANKFESFVDVFAKAKNALIIGALTVVGIACLMNG